MEACRGGGFGMMRSVLRRVPPQALLLAIVGLAVALRVGVVAASGGGLRTTDSGYFFGYAEDILSGAPTADRSNGYPLLIALLSLALPGAWVSMALVTLNVVASGAVVALVGWIGRRVGGWDVGLLAALGTAVYPNQLNYVRYLLTEAPATFLLVAAVWLLLRRRAPISSAVVAGGCLGLGVLLRSSLLGVGVFLLVVLVAYRRPWREVAGLAVGGGLILALNLALIASGTIAPTRHTGPNMLMAIQSSSTEGIVFSIEAFSEEEQARPLATYLRFAAERPATFVRQRASALWELWGPWPEPGDPDDPRTVPVRLLIGLRFVLIVLAAAGLAQHVRDERAWLLAAPILAITAIHVVFFAVPRFTYVVEPLAAVLAAWFVADLAARHRRAGSRGVR
ncbi:MAG: hypothetical protein ABJF88_10775 [Rhodothermales bacterium]